MSRPKSARNCELRPWFKGKSAKEGRFLQIGNSWFLSERVKGLHPSALKLFLCMGLEAGGYRDVIFPESAAKKYGFSPSTFRRGLKELEGAKFIERLEDENRSQYAANKFRFLIPWANGN